MKSYEESYLVCISGYKLYVSPSDLSSIQNGNYFLGYDFDGDSFDYHLLSDRKKFKNIHDFASYTDDLGDVYEGDALISLFKKAVTAYREELPEFRESEENFDMAIIAAEIEKSDSFI